MKLHEYLLETIYPPRCPGCDEVLHIADKKRGFCKQCNPKVHRVSDTVCACCGRELWEDNGSLCKDCKKSRHYFSQSKGIYRYDGIMKLAMYRLKYGNRRSYARIFVQEGLRSYQRWIMAISPDVIVPIPMYPKKERRRGYNQAAVLARELSKYTGVPINEKLLYRTRNTKPLKSLNSSERRKNLKNAFIFRKNSVQYENILLVDDIYTTGATMDEAARVLQIGGVKHIYGLCACIGKLKTDDKPVKGGNGNGG